MCFRNNYIACIPLIMSLMPGMVFAHAHLLSQTPVADSAVAQIPGHILLNFSEGVEPAFSGVTLTGPAQQKVAVNNVSVEENNNKQLIVPLNATLTAGEWRVDWHVVSVDGHKTHGSYRFHVK